MSFSQIAMPSDGRLRAAVFGACVYAGFSSTAALVLVNTAARDPSAATMFYFAIFAAATISSIVAARWASRKFIIAVEAALHELKVRIAGKIERAELGRIESIGKAEIFDRVSQNLAIISLAGSQVGPIVQSLGIFVLAFAYLLYLSPLATMVLLPILFGGLFVFRRQQRRIVELLDDLFTERLSFFDRLMDIILGAKEIKLNRARAHGLARHYKRSSTELRDLSIGVSVVTTDSLVFLNFVLFALLAALVYLIPSNFNLDGQLVPRLVIILLFAWGSLQTSVVGYIMYIRAERALDAIAKLEAKLDEGALDRDAFEEALGGVGPEDQAETPSSHLEAGAIELGEVEFHYPDVSGEPGFRLGPINLRVAPGELLFIVGGNGAGKSTLLKLLTGLYEPSVGALRVGGVRIGRHNVAAYRELMSVIFTDVHLFTRAYGLLEADPNQVNALLDELDIGSKTAFVGGRFTNRRLSSGQRKRLAMVISMLEDRPIVILDEWAADQDPGFRKHFYEHMLPALCKRGKTVIVVTHDDRYFDCADRVAVLDQGQIREFRD